MWFEEEFPDYLGSGFNLWREASPEVKTEYEKDINYNLELSNGITYVNLCQKYWELFTFDTNHNHIHYRDRKLLIRFMLYFKEQAHDIICQGEKNKIILPDYAKLIVKNSHIMKK